MKQTFTLFFLTSTLVLAACNPATTSVIESTPLSLPTNTLIPVQTATFLPPTATPTETIIPAPAIPDYMKSFFEGEYDKASTNDKLYFVYDETSVRYAPGNGIVFNERIIKSWAEIDYAEDGVYKRGIILDFVMRGGDGIFQYYSKHTWASSAGDLGGVPSQAWLDRMSSFFANLTPDNMHPILVTSIENLYSTGEVQLYEGIFPLVDGKPLSVHIPGIGTVLPITNAKLIDEQ